MLQYEIRPAATNAETAPALILMHGRGANRFDLLGLADHLPRSATLIFPEAPFAAAPWGYGPGSAWYRFLGRNKPEPESFSRSLDELADLIAHINAPRVLVGGFSQGGTLGIACALANPGSIKGVLNFSGFLADHPRVQVTPETVRGTSFFWGHGRRDANIPFELAIEGRALLESASADLTAHDYDIGHWIDPQELSDAVEWLDRIL
jgi:phospholipase/carboxylesterase